MALEAALRFNANDATAHYLLGTWFFSRAMTGAASREWEASRQLNPRRTVLDASLGLALLHEERDFAGALGVSEEEVTASDSLPGTKHVVEKFREICGGRSVAEAVAALYAYESQVPEIATTKIDGLKKFYGITEPAGLAYFEVHEEADKEHRAAWRGWLETNANGDEAEILKSTNEALDALWGALSAVHSSCGRSSASCAA